MKIFINLTCLALICFVPDVESVADSFCEEKQREGYTPGTVYNLEDTCEMCACDGALRMFCTNDMNCKRRKKEEYDALYRKPCYKGGSKYTFGSQVQQDCNICTCNNAQWQCTTDTCSYGTVEEQPNLTEEQCKDTDKRCKGWLKRNGEGVCKKKSVLKRCPVSCKQCSITSTTNIQTGTTTKQKKKKPVVPVVCEDENENCEAWSERQGLCKTHKYMKSKCKLSCRLCTPSPANTTEINQTSEETKKERVKTAEELAEEEEQKQIEEWRQRLIAEGQLVDTANTVIGCVFHCGGEVYPWGSVLQDSYCGVCTCRKRAKYQYYFHCTNQECESDCNRD